MKQDSIQRGQIRSSTDMRNAQRCSLMFGSVCRSRGVNLVAHKSQPLKAIGRPITENA